MSQIKVELQETMGNDRSIAEAAWTSSNNYSQKKKKTDEEVAKLITFLAEHKHSTPFEAVVFRFWIKMPIATDRQFMTHRIQSSSGMSGRYRRMPSEYLDLPEDFDSLLDKLPNGNEIFEAYYKVCENSNSLYSWATDLFNKAEKEGLISNLEYKRLREFYRGMLPQHNMTERISIMNLRSFANFQKLRNSPHAQAEIREVAELMLKEIKSRNICPIAIAELEKNNWQL